MRTQRTFKQDFTPPHPPRFFRMELVKEVSLGRGFEGARCRTYTERGDIIEAEESTARSFLDYGWCKLLPGESVPGEPLPTLGEVPTDLTKIPPPPTKMPEKLRVRLLDGNVSLGNKIVNAEVGKTYVLPFGDAMSLARRGAVEILDELPKPEIKVSVDRAELKPLPVVDAGANASFMAAMDRRLGR